MRKIAPHATLLAALAFAFFAGSFLVSCGGAQKASAKGYETVETPASELESIKAEMEKDNIASGIGIGESESELTARKIAADESRAALAASIQTIVERMSESYTQNVNAGSKTIWEEGTRNIVMQQVNGSTVYKTIPQFNEDNNQWKIYVLTVLNPEIFKKALETAPAVDNQEELEMRVKKDEMMGKMDAAIATYKNKYEPLKK
jgi:hypothetical protein